MSVLQRSGFGHGAWKQFANPLSASPARWHYEKTANGSNSQTWLVNPKHSGKIGRGSTFV
jgi:hypothetical protein